MVDRAHSAWKEDNIAGVLLMDSKAAFPSVGRERLIHLMKAKQIDGDHIRWTESFLLDRTVEMVIKGNVLQSHPMEAGVLQGSPVLPIVFAIHTSGLITWVEEKVQRVKGLSFIDNLGWIATGKDVNQVVRKLKACAAESIEWATRRDLQFDTAMTGTALFTRRRGHKKHLQQKLKAKITVRDSFVWLNKEVTRWLGHQQKTFPSGRNGSVRVDALCQSRLRHPGGGLLRARR